MQCWQSLENSNKAGWQDSLTDHYLDMHAFHVNLEGKKTLFNGEGERLCWKK